ncbi:MAG TPA: DUF308 domain-containing protein [Thermoleophilaceae bacterium]|jgi:uncharacterized membrane protein HdeD (DUF308 family)
MRGEEVGWAGPAGDPVARVGKYWWLWIVSGIAWGVVALVVLQFDQASIKTVGVIIGLMFLASGVWHLAVAAMVDRLRWLYALFGVLMLAAGVISLIEPEQTFAGVADILGFLFLLVGIFWTAQAFVEREAGQLWWIGLIAGVLMIMLAFWTSGQFFVDKSYVLLVFAGIWALMHSVTDIVRAFAIRSLAR